MTKADNQTTNAATASEKETNRQAIELECKGLRVLRNQLDSEFELQFCHVETLKSAKMGAEKHGSIEAAIKHEEAYSKTLEAKLDKIEALIEAKLMEIDAQV